ncbi:carbamate kinase [Falsigemmobacter intermedius]|uniref:Carbamate kinase n=1 Tax=Falsigemmobacter intermedius TaxID=1553448 RepID=A0A3S3Y9R6_9RHOB|nr:carbamate kinase [Falsigemmobacter intermedius]RWY36407.1 carbamate kinase [Falsigemmobacter intermedius]
MLARFTLTNVANLIEQELENALGHARPVATLLTQVIVDPADPAFAQPSKPVGPLYSEVEARRLSAAHGWAVVPEGAAWRRVVPSPMPQEIPDLSVIRLLLVKGVVVICAGGGGVPVIRQPDGSLTGVEAVIDKDHASRLLAQGIGANALLMLTDVDGVQQDFGAPSALRIPKLTATAAKAMALPAGSMAPKVAAGLEFVHGGGLIAGIGRMEDAAAILEGAAGTLISI